MPFRRPLRAQAAVAVALVTLVTGCAGRRASLTTASPPAAGGDAGTPVGDGAVDTVLGDLERPMASSFTATYAITRKLGATAGTALVSRGPLATSVTVGDVRFVRSDADHTCVLSTKACEDTINDARISDLGIASSFWRDAPARVLRVTYGRRASPASGDTVTIAGQSAQCVSVPVGTGAERYCALPAGAMARWDTAYITIELTAWEPNVRQESFELPIAAKADGS